METGLLTLCGQSYELHLTKGRINPDNIFDLDTIVKETLEESVSNIGI